jgi:hypothetical protein
LSLPSAAQDSARRPEEPEQIIQAVTAAQSLQPELTVQVI